MTAAIFLAKPFYLSFRNTPLALVDKNLNGIWVGGLLTIFANFINFMAFRAHELLHETYAFILKHNVRVLGTHLVFKFIMV